MGSSFLLSRIARSTDCREAHPTLTLRQVWEGHCSNQNSNPRQFWLSKPLGHRMSAQTGIRTRGSPDCPDHWATECLLKSEFEPEAVLTVQTTGPPNVCSDWNSNPRQSWLSRPLGHRMSAQIWIRTRGDPDCPTRRTTMSQLCTPMSLTTNL